MQEKIPPLEKVKQKWWQKWMAGASAIVILALSLWLPSFATLPSGLNRDEAALGYNAYSLLKTGKDEWGIPWPISFTSFGDQKLPGYIYTLIPFIALFDLQSWVVRLPSLLAGIVVIVGSGLIAIMVARSYKADPRSQLKLSLLTMTLVAISPWQMHFSRVAYETHLAMAMFISGLASLLFGLKVQQKNQQRCSLIIASILFACAMLTYHSYQIFIPLFVLLTVIIFGKKIVTIDRIAIFVGISIGLLAVALLIFGGVMRANQIKSIGTSPFNRQGLLLKAVAYREASGLPLSLSKALFNRTTEGIVVFGQNYLSSFSGIFFFVHGSGHGDHNPGNGNNLHLILAPFILLGFLLIVKKRESTTSQLLLAWLFLALIPSSLTTNPLLEVRIATVFPVLELIAALGLWHIFQTVPKKWLPLSSLVATILLTSAAVRLFIFYTEIAPHTAVDNSSYHKLAKAIFTYQSQADSVLTQSSSSSPYIWYLLENKISPELTQKELKHYLATDEGFLHVKQLGNVFFETINWENLAQKAAKQKYILILKPTEISDHQRTSNDFKFLDKIEDKQGNVIYEIWEYKSSSN